MAQPLETTTYSLVAKDSSGCVRVVEKKVLIQKNRSVYIPTAFSPSNNLNEFFVVFGGQDVRYLKALRIYNRWGSLMFDVSGDLKTGIPDFGWNGQFNGEPMPAGIYLYEAEVEFLDGEKLPYRGEVYLMR
jgi:gliding motility-associated-like protein